MIYICVGLLTLFNYSIDQLSCCSECSRLHFLIAKHRNHTERSEVWADSGSFLKVYDTPLWYLVLFGQALSCCFLQTLREISFLHHLHMEVSWVAPRVYCYFCQSHAKRLGFLCPVFSFQIPFNPFCSFLTNSVLSIVILFITYGFLFEKQWIIISWPFWFSSQLSELVFSLTIITTIGCS